MGQQTQPVLDHFRNMVFLAFAPLLASQELAVRLCLRLHDVPHCWLLQVVLFFVGLSQLAQHHYIDNAVLGLEWVHADVLDQRLDHLAALEELLCLLEDDILLEGNLRNRSESSTRPERPA